MDIAEWAKLNGMDIEQFKDEIAKTMAVIGSIELDEKEDKGEGELVWTIEMSDGYKYRVSVDRTSHCK